MFYLVPIANNTDIQVWIQGERVGGQWQFDDGSPVPDFCPIQTFDSPNEVHLRARGSTDFFCPDSSNNNLFNYSCEYHP